MEITESPNFVILRPDPPFVEGAKGLWPARIK